MVDWLEDKDCNASDAGKCTEDYERPFVVTIVCDEHADEASDCFRDGQANADQKKVEISVANVERYEEKSKRGKRPANHHYD